MMNRSYITSGNISPSEIKRIRQTLNMTQKEFAALLNVSSKSVERWEISDAPVSGAAASLIRIFAADPGLAEKIRIPEKIYPLRLLYKYHDVICTLIDVDELRQLVQIKNYTSNLLFRAFGVNESPDYQDYRDFLESRCFPRERDKMKLILRELDLPFYDPLMIIEKTGGRMAEDDFSIEIVR
ncbi:MAG: helix-turn-helix domain-containing protein [Lachnospiraceae bacterium]|nr:helix-turn-helix domain-containing protein [Lachnospiraceae bacterium]